MLWMEGFFGHTKVKEKITEAQMLVIYEVVLFFCCLMNKHNIMIKHLFSSAKISVDKISESARLIGSMDK